MTAQATANTPILRFLTGLPLFEGVSPVGLEDLARAARIKKVFKGSCLFFQGDPARGVYLVCRGAVAIQLENPDGRGLVINEIHPGECFGELGVLTGQPHSTAAEALEDSEIFFIPRAAFEAVLAREACLALRLLELTARRLQDSSRREEALAFYDAQQRLARLLLELDVLAAGKGYLTFSHEELAQRTGQTRQTVSTILGRWRRKDWLLTGRGHIVLLNRFELAQLLEPMEAGQQEA